MNQRIRELAKHNGFIHDNMPVSEYNDAVRKIEKIAELIIRECARVDSEENNPDHVDGETYNQTILQHFGIK